MICLFVAGTVNVSKSLKLKFEDYQQMKYSFKVILPICEILCEKILNCLMIILKYKPFVFEQYCS